MTDIRQARQESPSASISMVRFARQRRVDTSLPLRLRWNSSGPILAAVIDIKGCSLRAIGRGGPRVASRFIACSRIAPGSLHAIRWGDLYSLVVYSHPTRGTKLLATRDLLAANLLLPLRPLLPLHVASGSAAGHRGDVSPASALSAGDGRRRHVGNSIPASHPRQATGSPAMF